GRSRRRPRTSGMCGALGIGPWPVCAHGVVSRCKPEKCAVGSRPRSRLARQRATVMPGAELTTSVRGGRVVLTLLGDLNVTGAASAEAAIRARVVRGQSLVIDMSALDFIDCGSLGALLRVQR